MNPISRWCISALIAAATVAAFANHALPGDAKSPRSMTKVNDIPPGFRAIGVPISENGLPRYYHRLNGSRVDLVLLIKSEKGVRRILILKDALVLAADRCVPPEGEIKSFRSVITFALKQEDESKLNIALDMGELRVLVPERMESHDLPKRK